MGKSARRSFDRSSSPLRSAKINNEPYVYYQQSTGQPETNLWSTNEVMTQESLSLGKPLNQIKDVINNKTSKSSISSDKSFTSGTTTLSPSLSSSTAAPPKIATQKPPTTTYKSYTTTYRAQASTRSYFNNYANGTKITELERLRMREEFFATYDVMTGVRIAATLGGFFFLMVFLVVYKSRSHSHKALNDPKICAAAAAVVQEEEDREFQEAFEKTAFSLYQDELDFSPVEEQMQRDRMMSLGNVSCPPLLNPGLRFSSVGGGNGYSSLLEPPRRYSDTLGGKNNHRRQSTSESSRILSAYHLNDNYSNQNENFFNESDGEEADDEFEQQFTTTAEIAYPFSSHLSVPRGQDSRRSSNMSGMTCCSTESSFLERRCSAFTLGISSLPLVSQNSSRRLSREAWEMEAPYPGIHVIDATPKTSPCPSERLSHENDQQHIKMLDRHKLKRHDDNSIDSITEYPNQINHTKHCSSENNEVADHVVNFNSNSNTPQNIAISDKVIIEHVKRAPLASLSSFKMSSIECQDSEAKSGSNSVFGDETDDDMEQFSTDSDEISLTQSPLSTELHLPKYDSNCNKHRNNINGKTDNNRKLLVTNVKCDGTSVVVNIDNDNICGRILQTHHNNHQQNPKLKSNSAGLINTSSAIIERHQSNDKLTRPASFSGCCVSNSNNNNNYNNYNKNHPSSSSPLQQQQQQQQNESNNSSSFNINRNSNNNNNGSECVTIINVIDPIEAASSYKKSSPSRPSSLSAATTIVASTQHTSVILEMPVITTTQNEADSNAAADLNPDPSIPGTSRKWSKETLF